MHSSISLFSERVWPKGMAPTISTIFFNPGMLVVSGPTRIYPLLRSFTIFGTKASNSILVWFAYMKAPVFLAVFNTFLFLNLCLWATFTKTNTRGCAIILYITKEQVFHSIFLCIYSKSSPSGFFFIPREAKSSFSSSL